MKKLLALFLLMPLLFVACGDEDEPTPYSNPEQVADLVKLCVRLLQPLRDAYGEPFIISSGFRSPEVNKAVGGVATSQHMRGQAVDISVKEPRELLTALLRSRLDFDQAILYQDGRNNFLHLSYHSGHNRRQVLFSKNTKQP